MGFTASINRMRKNPYKVLNEEEMCYIEHWLGYFKNPWAQQNYASAEEYAKSFVSAGVEVENNILKYYKNSNGLWVKENNEEDYYWCSNGNTSGIHEWMKGHLIPREEDSYYYIMNKEDLKAFGNWCLNKIEERINWGTIEFAFSVKEDEANDHMTYITFPIDGIELNMEDGKIKRLYSDPGIEKGIIEEDCEISAYLLGLRIVTKILSDTDWENEEVVYSGGW